MMKLIDQVCTREQGDHLQQLGISGPCLFRHMRMKDSTGSYYVIQYVESGYEDYTPAFTVAELGVMIPDDGEGAFVFFSAKDMGDYKGNDIAGFSVIRFEPYPTQVTDEAVYPTEAQARAALLIQLLESGEVTPAEVNTRLQ